MNFHGELEFPGFGNSCCGKKMTFTKKHDFEVLYLHWEEGGGARRHASSIPLAWDGGGTLKLSVFRGTQKLNACRGRQNWQKGKDQNKIKIKN